MSTSLQDFSDQLAGAVERAAASVVAMHARPRVASSGIVWRPGIAVTAAHTVRRDGEVPITLADGRRATGTPAGHDAVTDIAVFKLSEPGTAASFAPAAAARVGQMVLQVGRIGPGGPSASFGVIAAVLSGWRTWAGAEIEQLFDLDLRIHLGFSGSPLIDASGRVVGLNTSGLARNAAVAIPAPVVDRIVDTLLSRGRVARGYLGVGVQPVRLPGPVRTRLAIDQDRGLIVVSLDPDGPAGTAGIELGDVLLRVGGAALTDARDLLALLSPARVGSTLEIDLLRAGSLAKLRIAVAERAA